MACAMTDMEGRMRVAGGLAVSGPDVDVFVVQ